MSATLQLAGLAKSFGGRPVLRGVDLSVPAGGVTAVLGASGCGKTTLLRLIAGFEEPDAGAVRIAGRTVAGGGAALPAHRRDVGYVAQDGALFPHLSVAGNIGYGLRGRGTAHRVAALLETVSLPASTAARRPHELSGGQQQRVALARALARNPQVMLLDEPFSALDAGLRAATRKAVAATLAHAGVTTLLVTHDQQEAMSMADQVAVMRDGRFTQVGSPRQVYTRPADVSTAASVGECVLLACRVDGGRAETVLGSIAVDPPDGVRGARGDAVVLLRPEQLVATAVADGAPRAGTGTVLAADFLGAEVVLSVDPHGGGAPVTVRQVGLDAPPVGARVHLDVRGAGVVFACERSGG